MEPLLITILIMVAVGVGGAIVLIFVRKLPGEVGQIAQIGVIAVIVIVLLILLWRLVQHSGAV